jgi:hypothetical protein
MYSKKKHLMPHHLPAETIHGEGLYLGGYRKWLEMCLLFIRLQFSLKCKVKSLEGMSLRLGSIFFTAWRFIDHDSICTTGNILKLNRLYTYKENGNVDIVRLIDVYCDKGYLYCTLYFFNRNRIINVSSALTWLIYYLANYE